MRHYSLDFYIYMYKLIITAPSEHTVKLEKIHINDKKTSLKRHILSSFCKWMCLSAFAKCLKMDEFSAMHVKF